MTIPLSLCICLSRLPQISDSLSFIREILQQLTNQRASIEEDIQSSFEDLHKQLDVRKSVLLMELEVTYGLKQKVHACFLCFKILVFCQSLRMQTDQLIVHFVNF